MARFTILLVALVLVVQVSAAQSNASPDVLYEVSAGKYLMGTRVDATLRHPDIKVAKEALYSAFWEMQRVEDLLSLQKPISEIARVNESAGVRPVKVSVETFRIVARAKRYAERFGGLFDVTVGPLSEEWGFSSERAVTSVPDAGRIAALQRLVGYRDVILDEADTTVYLARAGMMIDLGGIAKGYAIDRGVAVLKEGGIEHFILNAGGDVYAYGRKDDTREWRIGIKDPRDPAGLISTFGMVDRAVATSGDYERFAIIDGKRYHHILDPRTGYPAPGCRSVSVVAASAEEADVLATYLFVLGPDHLDQAPDVPFLIVDADGAIEANAAMQQLDGFQMQEAP